MHTRLAVGFWGEVSSTAACEAAHIARDCLEHMGTHDLDPGVGFRLQYSSMSNTTVTDAACPGSRHTARYLLERAHACGRHLGFKDLCLQLLY